MRLIDADALIDGYKHMGYDSSEHPDESYMEGWCKGFNSAVDHCIHHAIHAPTLAPELHWIPCSERLPEEDPTVFIYPDEKTSRFVLATVDNMTYPNHARRVLLARYSYSSSEWVVRSSNYGVVIAWMPLPEPYRKESEGDGCTE